MVAVVLALLVSGLVGPPTARADDPEEVRVPGPPTGLGYRTSGEESIFFGPYWRDVTISWTAPQDLGTAPVDHYRLTVRQEGAEPDTSEVEPRDPGETKQTFSFRIGADRTVEVAAVSAAGEGEASQIVVPLPSEPPGKPIPKAEDGVAGGSADIKVSWKVTPKADGSALRGFDVLVYRAGGDGARLRTIRTTADVRSKRLKMPRGRYWFAVRSVGDESTSEYVDTRPARSR